MTETGSSSHLVKALETARLRIMTYQDRRVGRRRQRLAFRGHAGYRPHPDLSETQAKVIAPDNGMRGGKAKIRVQPALLYYALRRLGLDTSLGARKPHDQQIVILNTPTVTDDQRDGVGATI